MIADADLGDNLNFLASLEAQQERYVVAVRMDFQMSMGSTPSTSVSRDDELLHTLPHCQ